MHKAAAALSGVQNREEGRRERQTERRKERGKETESVDITLFIYPLGDCCFFNHFYLHDVPKAFNGHPVRARRLRSVSRHRLV